MVADYPDAVRPAGLVPPGITGVYEIQVDRNVPARCLSADMERDVGRTAGWQLLQRGARGAAIGRDLTGQGDLQIGDADPADVGDPRAQDRPFVVGQFGRQHFHVDFRLREQFAARGR